MLTDLTHYRLTEEQEKAFVEACNQTTVWHKECLQLAIDCYADLSGFHYTAEKSVYRLTGLKFSRPRNKAFWKRLKGSKYGWVPIRRSSPAAHLEIWRRFTALRCSSISDYIEKNLGLRPTHKGPVLKSWNAYGIDDLGMAQYSDDGRGLGLYVAMRKGCPPPKAAVLAAEIPTFIC